jgi:DNA-binding SARP family transcriptional activator
MEPLRIFTFGSLRLLQGEAPISLVETRKAEALLVFLAHNRRLYRREVLADLLWDERSQQQAMSNLRVVLASLRKHLDPYLTITRESVALNLEASVWSDAADEEIWAPLKMGQILSTSETQ